MSATSKIARKAGSFINCVFASLFILNTGFRILTRVLSENRVNGNNIIMCVTVTYFRRIVTMAICVSNCPVFSENCHNGNMCNCHVFSENRHNHSIYVSNCHVFSENRHNGNIYFMCNCHILSENRHNGNIYFMCNCHVLAENRLNGNICV